MPVLLKFGGIVIRMLFDRTFGIHLHAFYDGSELVVGLNPVRVIQSEVPAWVEAWVLAWVENNQNKFLPPRGHEDWCKTPRSLIAALHN
jgi:hypothetical protein